MPGAPEQAPENAINPVNPWGQNHFGLVHGAAEMVWRMQREAILQNVEIIQPAELAVRQTQVTPQATKLKEPTVYRSNEKGEYVVSTRPFGVEYEINFSWSNADELRRMIGAEYNIVSDGSVRNGLEVVSPVLQGHAGEQQVFKTCASIKKLKGATDESCGLHVHLDAADFYKPTVAKSSSLINTYIKYKEKKSHDKVLWIVHSSVIKFLIKRGTTEDRHLADCMTGRSPFSASSTDRLIKYMNDATFFPHRVLFVNHKGKMDQPQTCKILAHGVLGRRNRIFKEMPVDKNGDSKLDEWNGRPAINPINGYVYIDPTRADKMRVIILPLVNEDTKQLSRLKRLAAFYIAFDDVIASMLPSDRRANDFARRVSQRASLEDINSCRSVRDFMRLWFHLHDDDTIETAQHNRRHHSRYCGLNLHALLKHGTVEIRYLGGTIDPHEIIQWVYLHQTILDIAADTSDPRFNMELLSKASMIIRPDYKADVFFKKLKLRPETEQYFRELIGRLKEDDRTLVDELIEEEARVVQDDYEERMLVLEDDGDFLN